MEKQVEISLKHVSAENTQKKQAKPCYEEHETVDQDMLQLKDETNKEWIHAWHSTCKK
jgi:hypothetical protein